MKFMKFMKFKRKVKKLLAKFKRKRKVPRMAKPSEDTDLDRIKPSEDTVLDSAKPSEEFKDECAICQETWPESSILQLTCDCLWCQPCLNFFVSQSISGEGRFPPRCCYEDEGIDLEHAQTCLTNDTAVRLADSWQQLHTRDPIFCADVRCSTFIPSDDTTPRLYGRQFSPALGLPDESLACPAPECRTWTCITCRRSTDDHMGLPPGKCPDNVDEATRELARQNNWRICPKPGCGKVIERTGGCKLVQCQCGHEFCYQCGTSIRLGSEGHFECGCESNLCILCGRRKNEKGTSCSREYRLQQAEKQKKAPEATEGGRV